MYMVFKRIRYAKTSEEHRQKSVKSYQHPTNGGRFTVRLHLDESKFVVWDEVANMEASSGVVDNDTEDFHYLKKEAKNALVKLGIPFQDEGRVKQPYQQKSA
jgi:hypothetical protein